MARMFFEKEKGGCEFLSSKSLNKNKVGGLCY